MAKNIVIIGGGIIGLGAAYYSLQEGHQVTLLDKSGMDHGASYVNAGYLTPSHIISLASPGMMAKGIRWIFKYFGTYLFIGNSFIQLNFRFKR